MAGVSPDSLESHRHWVGRLGLRFPLLSDRERRLGTALHLIRRVGIGDWTIEIFRRATLLVDPQGQIAAFWGQVKIRGHALEVLAAARALRRAPPASP